ncbi:hypothetical protein [Legionella sp.]|uniref:hypothetical protein n=1 Tax=Legionella sp. TaxID=459 RepID=UPI003CAA9458
MNPVLKRLQETLFDQAIGFDDPNSLNMTLSVRNRFYRKIVCSHLILHSEYNLLGQQIRANLLSPHPVKEEHIVEQLIAARLLATLLEYVYQYYLIVPREVECLRRQQQLYCELLNEIDVTLVDFTVLHSVHGKQPSMELCYKLFTQLKKINAIFPEEKVHVGASFSQQVRVQTININLYRLLFIRSKRLLDLISTLSFSADWYHRVISNLDKYTDPFLRHVAWFFYVPRLITNLFLLLKHTLIGPWMKQEERMLSWNIRFQGQMLRRWFELGNDLAWVGVGIVNSFILTGVLAQIGIYLSIAFFGFDVAMSSVRTYIELNRLAELRKKYRSMITTENKDEIDQFLGLLDKQFNFELLRLGSHVMSTLGIFLSMCCAAPLVATYPIIPLVGATCLVLICFINFALVPIIAHKRPKDIIEIPSGGVKKLSFFAKRNEPIIRFDIEQVETSKENKTALDGMQFSLSHK